MKKKVLIIVAATLVMTALASASGWLMIASYPAPAPNARGYCEGAPFHDSILCDGSPPRVYDGNNPSNFIILDVPSGVWGLSAWFGNPITVTNYVNSYIYHLTTKGSVISSFRCPKDHPADLSKSPWVTRFVAIPNENLALELTSTGSVISSFRGPGTRLTAIQAVQSWEYIIGDPSTHKIYFAGYGCANLNAPSAIYAGKGTGDGPPDPEWFNVLDSSTNYIYSFRWVGPEPIDPASLGRVKALFE
jgi:hypothetical protein